MSQLRLIIAAGIRENREVIVARWLDRISARVSLNANEIFPTEELLNHVPILLDGVADYLETPSDYLDDGGPVTAKAMELGALRHRQGFDAYEILKEHEILARIIFAVIRPVATEAAEKDDVAEALECWEQIGLAIELLRQATVTHFLRLAAEQVADREGRLRRFNRMVSHELKNRVGALRGGAHMLQEPWLGDDEKARFQRMIIENADGLQQVLGNLESLSRLDVETRQRRNVLLPQAAAEVVRQLRDSARSRNVDVRIVDLPPVEVDAAAVELCLTNFVSNAIKYSDESKRERWVEISGELIYSDDFSGELFVRVRDNGIGVPIDSRQRLFQQFYRAHSETVTSAEGTGLGLSIARETAESLGGRAWAEFPDEGGSVFIVTFPSRRSEDAAAAGTRRPELAALDSVAHEAVPAIDTRQTEG